VWRSCHRSTYNVLFCNYRLPQLDLFQRAPPLASSGTSFPSGNEYIRGSDLEAQRVLRCVMLTERVTKQVQTYIRSWGLEGTDHGRGICNVTSQRFWIFKNVLSLNLVDTLQVLWDSLLHIIQNTSIRRLGLQSQCRTGFEHPGGQSVTKQEHLDESTCTDWTKAGR
jgi:hypothetical protein